MTTGAESLVGIRHHRDTTRSRGARRGPPWRCFATAFALSPPRVHAFSWATACARQPTSLPPCGGKSWMRGSVQPDSLLCALPALVAHCVASGPPEGEVNRKSVGSFPTICSVSRSARKSGRTMVRTPVAILGGPTVTCPFTSWNGASMVTVRLIGPNRLLATQANMKRVGPGGPSCGCPEPGGAACGNGQRRTPGKRHRGRGVSLVSGGLRVAGVPLEAGDVVLRLLAVVRPASSCRKIRRCRVR